MEFIYNDGGRADAGFKGETRDCVTRAIAIAAELPYLDVYNALNDLGKQERITKRKQKRSSARTGVFKQSYHGYIQSLGFRWVPCMAVGKGCQVHLRKEEIPQQGRLIVKLSRHLAAVIDGTIHDTSDPSRGGNRCVYGYYIKETS